MIQPDPGYGRESNAGQEAVHRHEDGRRHARNVRVRRRCADENLAPHACHEAEGAEQDQLPRSGGHEQHGAVRRFQHRVGDIAESESLAGTAGRAHHDEGVILQARLPQDGILGSEVHPLNDV